jgi:predicted negative regulator of RcsB-dependent stress response
MSRLLFLISLFAIAAAWPLRAAEEYLVRDGKAQAEIVIAEQPQRTVRLAAHDLRTYVEKISGARLPLVTQPTKGGPVQIYVGRSAFTDKLNITSKGLEAGAYRIVSGDHWMVLIGDDTEFVPTEPWPKNNTEIPKAQAEWDRITGAQWGLPGVTGYKCLLTVPGDIGRPDAATGKSEPWAFWSGDERGSFNAVAGFLHRLGVRWYMPGELGEVVPSLKSIPLPKIDETVRPDFALRSFNFRFAINKLEIAQWAMRLGTRCPLDIQVAHGMAGMTHRPDLFAAHPDWFALYGGQRQTQIGNKTNQLCYSNEELFQETVRNVRAQFDLLHYQVVSVMPPDGYTAICQCKLCEGKDTPARGEMGLLSDYVWDFVNRVAKEVGKTHPDRKVINCSYGSYALPPLKIAKLEPNVLVGLVGGRAPRYNKPEQQAEFRARREAWLAKTDNRVMVFENYPFTDRGWYLPAFTAHSMGESVNATKGYSQGEDISLTIRPDFATLGIGLNHFLVYFTARMYWGGKEQDADAMLREYCRLFYGPAEQEMLTFFNYCEANWQEMEKDKTKVDAALAYFATAQAKSETGSVHGRRLALMDDFLKDLRNKSQQLGKVRGPVPRFRLGRDAEGIVIDGKLDDEFWQKYPAPFVGELRELMTGSRPIFGTTFKAAWGKDGALYVAIRCDEHPGEKLNIGTTKHDDSALWYGDAVEVLIETEAHSYYQIAISPSGAVADLDRSASAATRMGWDSQAQVATHIADDHWTAEVRIPVTQDENDPLHQVIGRKPSTSLPWHFNICRQRIRGQAQEASAFSPTGKANFHEVMKFATLYEGRSHQFDAGPPDADYLEAMRGAADLSRQNKHAEALAACTAAAEGKITDFQKSAALEQAAAAARALRQPEVADQLAGRIPIDAVKKAVLMQNLLSQSKAPQLIAQFGGEDLSAWPFWKAGDGYFSRGRAYAITKAGKEAESDLAHALEFTSDPRTRESIHQNLASNRENNLHDDSGALAAYRAILDPARQLGSAEQYNAVQGIARILTKQGKFDDAVATLRKVDIEKTGGNNRGDLLLALGGTLRAAGRNDEARAMYQSAISDKSLDPRYAKVAGERLEKLK